MEALVVVVGLWDMGHSCQCEYQIQTRDHGPASMATPKTNSSELSHWSIHKNQQAESCAGEPT